MAMIAAVEVGAVVDYVPGAVCVGQAWRADVRAWVDYSFWRGKIVVVVQEMVLRIMVKWEKPSLTPNVAVFAAVECDFQQREQSVFPGTKVEREHCYHADVVAAPAVLVAVAEAGVVAAVVEVVDLLVVVAEAADVAAAAEVVAVLVVAAEAAAVSEVVAADAPAEADVAAEIEAAVAAELEADVVAAALEPSPDTYDWPQTSSEAVDALPPLLLLGMGHSPEGPSQETWDYAVLLVAVGLGQSREGCHYEACRPVAVVVVAVAALLGWGHIP